MGRSTRAAAAICILAVGGAVHAAGNKLTVVVVDEAAAPRTVLTRAANQASRAFRLAGVPTEWMVCDTRPDCTPPEGAVRVELLLGPGKDTPLSPDGLAYSVTCPSGDECGASYVFYDKVMEFAHNGTPPVEIALGAVMAHEVAHLMGLGHQRFGIMKRNFTSRDLQQAATGWLLFPPADALKLRAAVARLAGDDCPTPRTEPPRR